MAINLKGINELPEVDGISGKEKLIVSDNGHAKSVAVGDIMAEYQYDAVVKLTIDNDGNDIVEVLKGSFDDLKAKIFKRDRFIDALLIVDKDGEILIDNSVYVIYSPEPLKPEYTGEHIQIETWECYIHFLADGSVYVDNWF